MFWFFTALLTLVAVVISLWPLLRSTRDDSPDRGNLNAAVLENQLRELERDLADGNLSEENYAQAKADLERGFLETATDADARGHADRSPVIAIVLAIAIPLGAFLIYQVVGYSEPDPAAMMAGIGDPHTGGMEVDVQAMVERVRQRAEENPDDLPSWVMLGRSLYSMGDTDGAYRAFKHVVDRGYEDATVFAQYADVLAFRDGGISIQNESYALLQRALELEPDHEIALWLAGTAAFESGEYLLSQEYWTKLQGLLDPNSEAAEIIADNLEVLRERIAEQ